MRIIAEGKIFPLNAETISEELFSNFYTSVVPEFHSAGVYSSYEGIPISEMTRGKYKIQGFLTSIGLSPLVGATWAIQDIIVHLELAVTKFMMSTIEYEPEKFLTRRRVYPSFELKQLTCLEAAQLEFVWNDQQQKLRKKRGRKSTTTKPRKSRKVTKTTTEKSSRIDDHLEMDLGNYWTTQTRRAKNRLEDQKSKNRKPTNKKEKKIDNSESKKRKRTIKQKKKESDEDNEDDDCDDANYDDEDKDDD